MAGDKAWRKMVWSLLNGLFCRQCNVMCRRVRAVVQLERGILPPEQIAEEKRRANDWLEQHKKTVMSPRFISG
jgi:hypothetical protein